MHHSWSIKMEQLMSADRIDVRYPKINKRGRYIQLNFIIQILIWLRLWIIILVGIFLVCLLVFLLCNLIWGTENTSVENHRKHLSRIPGVAQFIRSKARSFDPAKDQEVGTCMICLEDFSSSKPVAQLNCNDKHVFHVECLVEWVKKNDICPMCR